MSTKAEFIAAMGGSDIVIAGDVFTANASNEQLSITGHGRTTGDGPLAAQTTGTLPAGLGAIEATGVLTLTGNLTGNVAATGVLTFGANAQEGEIVTIGATVYTFRASPSSAYDVDIGADADGSLDNLIAAITGGAGEGTAYGADTEPHPTVTAAAGTGDTMDVTALVRGTAGNAIASTTNVTSASWGAGMLAGGVAGNTVTVGEQTYTFNATTVVDESDNVLVGASASDTLDNLIAAIMGGAGEGTVYGTGTTEHATVTAAAGSGDTMDVTAKVAGTAGNEIAVSNVGANGSWGEEVETLAGGYNNEHYVIYIDANTVQLARSYEDAVAETPVPIDIGSTGSGTHTLSSTAGLFADRVETGVRSIIANGNRVSLPDVLESRLWDTLIAAL